jgi:hypothetical protein
LNRKPPPSLGDAAGSGFELAARLWNARAAVCGPDARAGEPLGRVLARVSR